MGEEIIIVVLIALAYLTGNLTRFGVPAPAINLQNLIPAIKIPDISNINPTLFLIFAILAVWFMIKLLSKKDRRDSLEDMLRGLQK